MDSDFLAKYSIWSNVKATGWLSKLAFPKTVLSFLVDNGKVRKDL